METLSTPTPEGAISYQLKLALESLVEGNNESDKRQPHWLKLYNASNFFDSRAVPETDLPAIAGLCKPFERVIVENHPRFCDERMNWFADHLDGQLEVAMGLETIHPNAMALMNKEMMLEDFDLAMVYCKRRGIDTRAFVLLHPPGVPIEESIDWTWRTVNYALDRGARHVSVIPVRSGNGWIDQHINDGAYKLPTIKLIRDFFCVNEQAQATLQRVDSMVEFDLWNWNSFAGGCAVCRTWLYQSIQHFNASLIVLPIERKPIDCECDL